MGIRFFSKLRIHLRNIKNCIVDMKILNLLTMTKIRALFTFVFFVAISYGLNASVEVIGSLKQVFTCSPGQVVSGQIRIQNSDPIDQEVRIYQTDYLYNYYDQTFYDEPGTGNGNKRSNTSWIEYSPKTVILKAKESSNVDFQITVPAADSINGTYWSVLMVEGVSPIDPNQTGQLSIRTVTRYAVQLINEVTLRGTGKLTFMEPTLVKESENSLFLAVDIMNDGDRFIAPELNMELYDEEGNLAKKLTLEKKGIFPETSVRYKFNLEGIPSKKTYTAMIVAAGQEDDVFGIEYTLYF